MAATRALSFLPAGNGDPRLAARSRPGAGRKSGLLILIKWLYLKSHSIDKLPAWPHRGKPPGIRDEPVRPCHTITVDTGAFSTDGSASILDAALAQGAQVPASPVSAASAARAAPRSWKAATNASRRPTNVLCHRRRRAADVPVPRGRRSAPDISALAGAGPAARAARARGVAPAAGARRDAAHRRNGGRAALRLAAGTACAAAAGRWRPTQLLHRQCAGRRYAGLSLASVATASVATTASPAASSATMSGGSAPNVVERDASGPVRLEFHIRRMPGGVFTDGILPRLAPGDTLTLEGPLGACVWLGWLAQRCAGQFAGWLAAWLIEWFTTARTIWCCWPPARDSRACSPS